MSIQTTSRDALPADEPLLLLEEAAERLAVRLVLPLGACHLPAFVILGIAPVVASVGMSMLSG